MHIKLEDIGTQCRECGSKAIYLVAYEHYPEAEFEVYCENCDPEKNLEDEEFMIEINSE